jgi:hypothetical protein
MYVHVDNIRTQHGNLQMRTEQREHIIDNSRTQHRDIQMTTEQREHMVFPSHKDKVGSYTHVGNSKRLL